MQRAQKIFYVAAAFFATSVVGGVAAADDPQAPQAEEQQQKNPTQVTAVKMSAKATVEKIDTKDRKLTLKDSDGNEFKVTVPQDVSSFDSIKTGDKISIDYYSSVALSLKKGEEGKAPSASSTTMKERTPGPLPGGMMAHTVSASAEVMKVDKAANKVTIKGPNGDLDTIDVTDSSLQADLGKLKKGDKIHASYTEAVAITVTAQKQAG